VAAISAVEAAYPAMDVGKEVTRMLWYPVGGNRPNPCQRVSVLFCRWLLLKN
jgi:hypothetical protein